MWYSCLGGTNSLHHLQASRPLHQNNYIKKLLKPELFKEASHEATAQQKSRLGVL